MKKILEKIGHLFSRPKMAAKAAIDLEVLANLELAQSFNHPVYLHFNKKNTELTSFTANITSITERQVVTKDIVSNQIRIILLSKVKKVSFVPESVKTAMIDKKNS